MLRILKYMIVSIISVVVILSLITWLVMQHAAFGNDPEATDVWHQSPQYKNGLFHNVHPTATLREGVSYVAMMKEFFNKPENVKPGGALPSVKTDLRNLEDAQPTLVWFGHSSYLIQHKGFQILVDPVLSGYAAPLPVFGKAFDGTDIYHPDELPDIDLLVLTHDHYYHLDYETLKQLHPRIRQIVAPLGVGSHLRSWDIDASKITELDWWQQKQISDSIHLTATPARHFSGRKFTQGKTLWASYVLQLNGYRLFLGGDSGYDDQFKKIGSLHGPFDLALLEAGQYGKDWPLIHMMPEETVRAAQDLRAEALMPVHWGKFVLANHAWTEPIERVLSEAAVANLPLSTPLIGQPVIIGQPWPQKPWWR